MNKNIFPLFFRARSVLYKHISMVDSSAVESFSESSWCKGVAQCWWEEGSVVGDFTKSQSAQVSTLLRTLRGCTLQKLPFTLVHTDCTENHCQKDWSQQTQWFEINLKSYCFSMSWCSYNSNQTQLHEGSESNATRKTKPATHLTCEPQRWEYFFKCNKYSRITDTACIN